METEPARLRRPLGARRPPEQDRYASEEPLGQSTTVDKLEAIRSEFNSLLVLAYQLGNTLEATLASIEPASAPRPDLTELVRQASLPDLVQAIFDGRGERSAAWLRTKLHQRLEARNGRRLRGPGRDFVAHAGNGNGVHPEGV